MVNYECVKCTFSSKNRSNYERHLKSNKHLLINVNNSLNDLNCDIKTVNLNQDINTDHICIYCKRSFKLSRYLGKHLKVCIVKQYHDNEYEKKIKSLTEELTLCKTEHDHYKTESEYYKMLLENAGGMLKKSIGTLAYITNNFKNAPSIKKLDVKDIDSEDIKNSDNFIRYIVNYHEHKTLHKYLGDFIVKVYKKENSTEQSIWSTDYTRLNYLVKELIDENSSQWVIDKTGIKTKKYLIEPLMAYLKQLLHKYLKICTTNLEDLTGYECEKNIETSNFISEIITRIDNKSLIDDISRYIAPYLFLNNKLLVKE